MPASQISVTTDQAKELMLVLARISLQQSRELEKLEAEHQPRYARIATINRKTALLRPIWDQLKDCI
jgi:hypothetical protein